MLEFNVSANTWEPPEIASLDIATTLGKGLREEQCNEYLHIIQTEPFIDSIYIKYDQDRRPLWTKRFAFHRGYQWEREDEEFFHEHCIKEEKCSYEGGMLDVIYEQYRRDRPEWHLQRYYTKSLRMLDHIYHCIKENTVKEMLYKAGLDNLAVAVDDLDEVNLLARKPSDLYDGLTMKVLRCLNCQVGARLISCADKRCFIKKLNARFPKMFIGKFNDAQCRYIATLIDGELTVDEVGRLFSKSKDRMAGLWCKSQFDLYMIEEQKKAKLLEHCKTFEELDPIYKEYIHSCDDPAEDQRIGRLDFLLFQNRKEFDGAIRRSNRRRRDDWQERDKDFIIRYPQTINDYCREAIYMRNCLLSYIPSMVFNDVNILLMRKADDVNMPFITLEINDNKLVQAYHRFNKKCTIEELRWIFRYCWRHDISTTDYFKVKEYAYDNGDILQVY